MMWFAFGFVAGVLATVLFVCAFVLLLTSPDDPWRRK